MKPRHRTYIIIASILLHVLFLLLWEGAIRLKLIDLEPALPPPVEEKPIVFDLQRQDRPNRVIETPQDAKVVEKQTKADFLSDKNALARNREANPDLKEGSPFSRGIFDTRELPVQPSQKGLNQPETREEKPDKESDSDKKPAPEREETPIETDAEILYREYEKKQREQVKPGAEERLPTVPHDSRESRALDMGGLSFNTYNWDFAPYMLALKARVQRNIHPPPAFTHLGMISGETLLRFKIYPNGEMRDLEILEYKGHRSLMVTSRNAITMSAPLPELPSNFPEPYLEVTGKFMYFITREKKEQ